jgi:DNA modification methylase|nr:MAG TPA: adenine-specific methyltransferase [Caudoviricetes sp.]
MSEFNFNSLNNDDCMEYMKTMPDGCVDLTLTDIPYGEVNRDSNGLRTLDKEEADVMTFNMQEFLTELYRVTKGTIIIFCGKEQLSEIHKFFSDKQKKNKGTVRQLIWKKSNPSPMNGQHIYLSGIENAVWFKKRGGTFNAHCKNTVFEYPCGRSKLHPTEKNHDLLKELILDNSNEGDIVFDPCSGSGSHLLVAKENNRQWLGVELNREYFNIASERVCR